MNYIDELARDIATQVDDAEPTDEDMLLYRIYAVLALAKGRGTTPRDIHDAWSAWAATVKPEHRSLIPFDDLSTDVAMLDWPYAAAVRAVAARRGLGIYGAPDEVEVAP